MTHTRSLLRGLAGGDQRSHQNGPRCVFQTSSTRLIASATGHRCPRFSYASSYSAGPKPVAPEVEHTAAARHAQPTHAPTTRPIKQFDSPLVQPASSAAAPPRRPPPSPPSSRAESPRGVVVIVSGESRATARGGRRTDRDGAAKSWSWGRVQRSQEWGGRAGEASGEERHGWSASGDRPDVPT